MHDKIGPFDWKLIEIDEADTQPRTVQLLEYSKGGVYQGEVTLGYHIRDGRGIYVYGEDGTRYEGSWKNNKRDGYGRMIYSNGDVFEGQWVGDQRCGDGTCRYFDGIEYKGSWLQNMQHGEGQLKFYDRSIYKGIWHKGSLQKQVTIIWPDKQKYEGEQQNFQKHGHGKYKWSSSDGHKISTYQYIGEWKEGRPHNKGTFINKDKK